MGLKLPKGGKQSESSLRILNSLLDLLKKKESFLLFISLILDYILNQSSTEEHA